MVVVAPGAIFTKLKTKRITLFQAAARVKYVPRLRSATLLYSRTRIGHMDGMYGGSRPNRTGSIIAEYNRVTAPHRQCTRLKTAGRNTHCVCLGRNSGVHHFISSHHFTRFLHHMFVVPRRLIFGHITSLPT